MQPLPSSRAKRTPGEPEAFHIRFDAGTPFGTSFEFVKNLELLLKDKSFQAFHGGLGDVADDDSGTGNLQSGLEVTTITILVSSAAAFVKVLVQLVGKFSVKFEIRQGGKTLKYNGILTPEIKRAIENFAPGVKGVTHGKSIRRK